MFDLFASENSEQAKEMIKTNLRQEIKRLRARAVSEGGSDEVQTSPISPPSPTTVPKLEQHQRKPTMLLTGPHFRSRTIQSDNDFKRTTIYPVSVRLFYSHIPFDDDLFIRFSLVFSPLFSSSGNPFLH